MTKNLFPKAGFNAIY